MRNDLIEQFDPRAFAGLVNPIDQDKGDNICQRESAPFRRTEWTPSNRRKIGKKTRSTYNAFIQVCLLFVLRVCACGRKGKRELARALTMNLPYQLPVVVVWRTPRRTAFASSTRARVLLLPHERNLAADREAGRHKPRAISRYRLLLSSETAAAPMASKLLLRTPRGLQ